MKKLAGILLILVAVAALIFTAAYIKVKQKVTIAKKAIVSYEVILPKTRDQYMEVRHIVLRGTNREIGRALGYIAQEWLNIRLSKFSSSIYAKARREYMKKNYPVMLERMDGVAETYGIMPDNNVYVTSRLGYDLGPFTCSSVYFTPDSTANGHAIMVRDMDFYITTMQEMIGQKPSRGDHKLFSRNYVMEIYPDKGYPSIIIGSMDLLGGGWDGINSKGLVVESLVDHDCPKVITPSETDSSSGMNGLMLPRFLLETCGTIEEAKIAILNNRIWFQKDGAHFQVADRHGNSFIYEQALDSSIHFTDNRGKQQIMTNHPVYKYPEIDKLPQAPAEATYNTFNRYRTLYNYLKNHKGKFSPDNAKEAISLVYGNTNDKSEGAAYDMPLRLIWTSFYDITERELEVRFYLKDGKMDPATGKPELILSEPFKFKLKANNQKIEERK